MMNAGTGKPKSNGSATYSPTPSPTENKTMTTVTCRCGTTWTQAGNRTGHCAACHRTFAGIDAFDAHQSIRDGRNVCTDPSTLRTKAGSPRYRSYVDAAGATVWRTTKVRLPGTWSDDPRHAPNHRSSTPDQPRTDPQGPEVPTDPPDGL